MVGVWFWTPNPCAEEAVEPQSGAQGFGLEVRSSGEWREGREEVWEEEEQEQRLESAV